jgi:hypothetical protein
VTTEAKEVLRGLSLGTAVALAVVVLMLLFGDP